MAAACRARGWPGVDLLLICGDFQAARNGPDVEVMSVPPKYRALGDFHEYYSGARRAPYLTLFVGGNHEAAAHLRELHYGGWAAPGIYYAGAANVLRVGPLRIAGLSGIWKGFDYRRGHGERLPFGPADVKSFYHVREADVRKLLQVRGQVDVGVSHDWPRGVEQHGDVQALARQRPMWREEIQTNTLGSVAAEYVMDRLRPAYWFSAHMHWKFSAIKTYPPPGALAQDQVDGAADDTRAPQAAPEPTAPATVEDPNEIDLDADEDEEDVPAPADTGDAPPTAEDPAETPSTAVPDDIRAQLPAAFTQARPTPGPKTTPGQPVPPTITNTTVRFLALSKCEPGRDFLQVCELHPVSASDPDPTTATNPPEDPNRRFPLRYDPEWLAITRALHPDDATAPLPADEGEEAYRPRIEEARAWVEAHVGDRLDVPHNFVHTAPPLTEGCDPELWNLHSGTQPREYTNPQTAAYCEMLGLKNLWDASEEEREERRARGPPAEENGGFRGGRGGRGGFGGRGRGRGGFGRAGGRGRGRGRGGRW